MAPRALDDVLDAIDACTAEADAALEASLSYREYLRYRSRTYRWAEARNGRPAGFEWAGGNSGPHFDGVALDGDLEATLVRRHVKIPRPTECGRRTCLTGAGGRHDEHSDPIEVFDGHLRQIAERMLLLTPRRISIKRDMKEGRPPVIVRMDIGTSHVVFLRLVQHMEACCQREGIPPDYLFSYDVPPRWEKPKVPPAGELPPAWPPERDGS